MTGGDGGWLAGRGDYSGLNSAAAEKGTIDVAFIRAAVRKADQQGRGHAAPRLLTLQPSAGVRKRPADLTYGLFALVLVCAGVVIGWLRPWQSGQAPEC